MKLLHCTPLNFAGNYHCLEDVMLHYKVQERLRPLRRREQTRTKVGDEESLLAHLSWSTGMGGSERSVRNSSPSKVHDWMYVTRTLQKLIPFSLSLLLPVRGGPIWRPQNEPNPVQMRQTLRFNFIIPTLITCPIWGYSMPWLKWTLFNNPGPLKKERIPWRWNN